jgi:hypothetical protein
MTRVNIQKNYSSSSESESSESFSQAGNILDGELKVALLAGDKDFLHIGLRFGGGDSAIKKGHTY